MPVARRGEGVLYCNVPYLIVNELLKGALGVCLQTNQSDVNNAVIM